MEKKIYRATRAYQKTVALSIDGKRVFCDFRYGSKYPVSVKASFITSDPKIQEALEKSPLFNVDYVLESVKVKTIQEGNPVVVESKVPEQKEEKSSETIIPEVDTVQKAREYLVQNYPNMVKLSEITTVAKINAFANPLGVFFPELKSKLK